MNIKQAFHEGKALNGCELRRNYCTIADPTTSTYILNTFYTWFEILSHSAAYEEVLTELFYMSLHFSPSHWRVFNNCWAGANPARHQDHMALWHGALSHRQRPHLVTLKDSIHIHHHTNAQETLSFRAQLVPTTQYNTN